MLWGKDMASQIAGPAEASSSPGGPIFATASVCWGGDDASRCSADQMERASNEVPPEPALGPARAVDAPAPACAVCGAAARVQPAKQQLRPICVCDARRVRPRDGCRAKLQRGRVREPAHV